ncbi:MAG: hypothetical protein DCC58_02140 [Chloroflexi bacterium]|nr:MAG: hypothetical protein DCC58_02140 [Chloroflexota bacterium]
MRVGRSSAHIIGDVGNVERGDFDGCFAGIDATGTAATLEMSDSVCVVLGFWSGTDADALLEELDRMPRDNSLATFDGET